MSTLLETDERPACIPGRKSELNFPKIKTSISTPRVQKSVGGSRHFTDSNNNYHRNVSFSHNINRNNNDSRVTKSVNEDSVRVNKSFQNGRSAYSNIPIFQSSTLLKLPSIDRSKSNSTSCIVSEICEDRQISTTDIGLKGDPKLNKSSSCVFNYPKQLQNKSGNVPCLNNNNVPFSINFQKTSIVKFPNILGNQKAHNSNFKYSHPASKVISQMNHETIKEHSNSLSGNNIDSLISQMNHKTIKPALNTFSGTNMNSFISQMNQEAVKISLSNSSSKNMSLVGRKSKLSPRTECYETSVAGSRSSALLLPISTTLRYLNRDKWKRQQKNKNHDN